ncbi:hypothetical protein IID24_01645 [Patescibacteria group bacterium]|nr:hypothetical protein [Patescibacteria group bacterium]
MNIVAKVLYFVKRYESDILLAIGVILISLLSFAVGYITAKEQLKEPVRIIEDLNYGNQNNQ